MVRYIRQYHRNLNKYVVLKKVNTDIQDLMNTRTEVDVLKNLKHTCLPQVFNFVEDNGSVYTVMEFIPGKSFKQYLDAGPYFQDVLLLSGGNRLQQPWHIFIIRTRRCSQRPGSPEILC